MDNTKLALVFTVMTIPLIILFSITSDAGWVLGLYPLTSIIGLVLGIGLAPVFLLVYLKTIGRSQDFFIREEEHNFSRGNVFGGLFPVLLATNLTLSLLFNPYITNLPMLQEYYLQWNTIILVFFNICAILQIPAFALFGASWTILDAGIISVKTDSEELPELQEYQNVGRWYLSFLKGYAGIGVVIALYQFLFEFLETYGNTVHWSAIYLIIILPGIVSMWVIPAVIVLNVSFKQRRNFILGIAKRNGIKIGYESE